MYTRQPKTYRYAADQAQAPYRPLRRFPHSGALREVVSDRPNAPILAGHAMVRGERFRAKVYANAGAGPGGSVLFTLVLLEESEQP